jgi:integrase/recombinase XerD
MPARKLPKTLSSDEIAALMRRPNLAAPTGLRNRCLLGLMHRSGLRVSEACGLHLRDVDLRELEIHLRPEIAKGGREATAYFDEETGELLERWKVVRRNYAARKPHLFTTLTGGPVRRQYVYEMIVRYARRAGIEKPVSPHVLRHTYATELLREGFNLVQVQKLMRHADIRSTILYTEIIDVELKEKVRRRR